MDKIVYVDEAMTGYLPLPFSIKSFAKELQYRTGLRVVGLSGNGAARKNNGSVDDVISQEMWNSCIDCVTGKKDV